MRFGAIVAILTLPFLLAACIATPYAVSDQTVVYVRPYDSPGIYPGGPAPQYYRQEVVDPTGAAPGTIVVDPANRYLYYVEGNGMAIRYGVGVGRAGMEWSGRAKVAFKREWPRWTPTKDMIARDPKRYAQWADGMDGGEGNPLGARALYLFEGGKDTYYRIHGTNEPASIGKAMSSGCIRMMNEDVIDLYERAPVGTPVIVLPVHQALS